MRFCTLNGDGSTQEGIECENNSILIGERHAEGFRRYHRVPFVENDPPIVSGGFLLSGFLSVGGNPSIRGTPDPRAPELLRCIESRGWGMFLRINTKTQPPHSGRNPGHYEVVRGQSMPILHAFPRSRKDGLEWSDALLAISPGVVIKVTPLGADESEHFVADFRTGKLLIQNATTLAYAPSDMGSHTGKKHASVR